MGRNAQRRRLKKEALKGKKLVRKLDRMGAKHQHITNDIRERVQIVRGPDGKLQVVNS